MGRGEEGFLAVLGRTDFGAASVELLAGGDFFLGGGASGARGEAMLAAVREVDDEADDQPDEEANPVLDGQGKHQGRTETDP